jgi:thioredoxin reductase (NADPH)
MLDCLVVGAGPAGLTAALYLARFRRNVEIVDSGESRAKLIPTARNVPGFFCGVSGVSFLERLRRQLAPYGVPIHSGIVTGLERCSTGWIANVGRERLSARAVLLATGVADRHPTPSFPVQGIAGGKIRFCPICDGFEAANRHVGILGPGEKAIKIARFLRTYTDRITVLNTDGPMADGTECHDVIRIGADNFNLESDDRGTHIVSRTGTRYQFDLLYSALGTIPRSGLAQSIGAALNNEGCIEVDGHQRTSIAGIYAVGDVVPELDQISVALGHAAIAASATHTWLAEPEETSQFRD